MLLNERLEATIEVRDHVPNFAGNAYYETSLISDDGQTLHIFDGQLKEVTDPELEVGKRYKITFRPFINNRWIEFKIDSLEQVPSES